MKRVITWIIFLFLILSTNSFLSKLIKSDFKPNILERQYELDKTFFCNNSEDSDYNFNFSLNSDESSFRERDHKEQTSSDGGLMNSSWPMQGHDTHHTGLSQYITADNSGTEKWQVITIGEMEQSSAVIDKNSTIYFGTIGDYTFYALYSNGTMKWTYRTGGLIWSSPALGDDGIIYFTSWDAKLYALYPNGTLKWRFGTGDTIHSSPAIAKDGTIYFGGDNKIIYAINQNGTEKWHYPTGDFINSGPAIGNDGTVYIGSSDSYLYALYPNGTLRWRFKTGDWIKGNPSIAEDGTIYVPSFDGYLYALYPNGTMKWKATTGTGIAGAGVALASDGTIYVGTELLRAYYPNGTLKWATDVHGGIYGTVPAVSADGTIFVSAGLDLVAVNPDGTERWRLQIAGRNAYASPCIGADGTVYVGSTWYDLQMYTHGIFHAIGPGEQKRISIQTPIIGNSYWFGADKGHSILNKTVIIGSVNVKVNVSSPDELQSLHFYVDGSDVGNITAPPFEWTMNRRYGKLFPLQHTLTVTAYYKGGCSWSESIPVVYFHLFKHF
jgi:outer membrane protein assembly factor BamB